MGANARLLWLFHQVSSWWGILSIIYVRDHMEYESTTKREMITLD